MLWTVFDFWTTIMGLFGNFANETLGSPMLIGVIVFMFIMFFCLVLLIPFEALVVVMIPTCLLVALWIPVLQGVCALLVGLTIGMGLLKWIQR